MRNKTLIGITIAMIVAIMVAPSIGITIDMPGGTWSGTSKTATTWGKVAYSFDYDTTAGTESIQADILAVAQTTAGGKANAYVDVDPAATSDDVLGWNKAHGKVTAVGTVDVNVDGNSNDAKVASMAQVHSKVERDIETVIDPDTNYLGGEAWIKSAIGKEWNRDYADVDYQKGDIINTAEGLFSADSLAEGTATYYAALPQLLTAPITELGQFNSLEIEGSASGKTTLEAAVDSENGAIGGVLNNLHASGPAYSIISSKSSAQGTVGEDSKLVTGSMTAENLNEIEIAAANNRNPCDPAVTIQDAYVSGKIVGAKSTANSNSEYYECNPETGECDKMKFEANTEKEDEQSADVHVYNSGDRAYANSYLNPQAFVETQTYVITPDNPQTPEDEEVLGTRWVSQATNDVGTYAEVFRNTAGSQEKQDGNIENRVSALAYIPTGEWTASAERTGSYRPDADTDYVDTVYSQAEVSGNLGQVKINEHHNPLGMNAGAYLLFKKNDKAYANIYTDQGARADELPLYGKSTYIFNYAEILGPKAKSLGGVSSWDGVGCYGALENLKVGADPNGDAISTDMPDVQGYMWVDGNNDAMYNGPGFQVNPFPTMTPTGTYSGVTFSYTPSLSQRETQVWADTYQGDWWMF